MVVRKKININNISFNKPLISRELITENIEDYDIYRNYIDEDFKINKPFKSPFRTENIPSFGIFYNSKKELIYNDFLLGGGDVFTFVKYLFNYATWWEVYSRIGIDFWLDAIYICKNEMLETKDKKKRKYYDIPKVSEKNLELNIKIRKWKERDKLFWNKYSINLKTLKKYNVYPISHIFFKSNNRNSIMKADELAYSYVETKDDKTTYKIYQPYSKYKWMNNNDYSVWQGWNQMPANGKTLIITKSLKDVMCINEICKTPSVSLQNEKTQPKMNIINQLRRRFKDLFILYDNDFDKETNWGRKFSEKLAKEYGLIIIEIPEKYKSKDFSDLVKNHGKETAKHLLGKLMDEALFNKRLASGVPF